MGFFDDSAHLYLCLEALFNRLREDEVAMQPLVDSRLIIRLNLTDPKAEVTLNARQQPVLLTYGPGGSRPILDVALSAQTLHEILLDELSVREAMNQGKVRLAGPFLKALVLVTFFRSGQQIYHEVLRDLGLA
jgi:hypothetical protein